ERKVKLISVQASRVVKKIVMVRAMALGCDQKKASIQPARAPISQSERAPMRMPICALMSAHAGQSFCTGKRRTGFAAGLALCTLACSRSSLSMAPTLGLVSCTAIPAATSGCLVDLFGRRPFEMEQFEAAFLDGEELAGDHAASNPGPSERHRDGGDNAPRPRAHHVHLVGEIDRLLDVMGHEQHGLVEVAPQLHQPFLHFELG